MTRIALKNRTIWITGASSGIGKGLAESLIRDGNQVIVTARDTKKLEQLKVMDPDRVTVIAADIANPDCISGLQRSLSSVTDRIDTVVLNAGNCEYLDVHRYESALVDRVMQVNVLGMSRCIEASLDLLKASTQRPHLVGVSSAAAITGLPRAEAYGASKTAVAALLESLGLDLHQFGIDVSIVYPGFVDTPLTRKNDFDMPFLMETDLAVKKIIEGIEKRHRKISFPRPLIWSLKLMAAMPESLRFRMGLGIVRESRSDIK